MSLISSNREEALSDIPGSPYEIEYTRQDGIALVSFSRPPHNHFSPAMIADLADHFERADVDPEVRATVLASRGKHFCAGADLHGSKREPTKLYAQGLRLFGLRKPMVAAVQGAAVGGGLGLTLVADFRVVGPGSRLSTNFVKIGTHPGFGISYMLGRIAGEQTAADMLLTGRRLTGEEAYQRGLADRLAPDEHVLATAIDLASSIADNAPLAVEATRATLRGDLVERIRQQTTLEAEKQMRLFQTEDYREGLLAVAQRRTGKWTRR